MQKYSQKKLPRRLPKFLHKYFWEAKADQINPDLANFYIINRLLDKGNLVAIKWVLTNFPKSLIKKTIQTKRDWQKKSINFWAHYFKLKNEEVKCLSKDYLKKRYLHWHY